jgi:hypothetical protein
MVLKSVIGLISAPPSQVGYVLLALTQFVPRQGENQGSFDRTGFTSQPLSRRSCSSSAVSSAHSTSVLRPRPRTMTQVRVGESIFWVHELSLVWDVLASRDDAEQAG